MMECELCGWRGERQPVPCDVCLKSCYCSEECKKKALPKHEYCCFPVDRRILDNPKNVAYREAHKWNIFMENKAIEYLMSIGANASTFQTARHLLLSAVASMAIAFPAWGRAPKNATPEQKAIADKFELDVREAGRILCETEGDRGMRDRLVWSFMPRRFAARVNGAWDGIGGWDKEEEPPDPIGDLERQLADQGIVWNERDGYRKIF